MQICNKFKLLFEQYATKQEIYEKIDAIVKERNEMKTNLKKKQP